MRYMKIFILFFLSAITVFTSCRQKNQTQDDSSADTYYSESESDAESASVGYIILKNDEQSADLYDKENGNVILKMFSGDVVTVYSINAEWAKISYSGKEGYMKLENLSFSEPEPTEEISAVSSETSSENYSEIYTVGSDTSEQFLTGQCGENAYWKFSDGLFTMYGSGETWSYDPFIPWDYILEEIKAVIVEEGITCIGRMSFSDCKNLTSVALPDTLTLIAPCAFVGCSSLSSITIPASVTYIAFDAFDKESLKDIYYEGSESDWNNVKFYEIDGYELITDAEIHFNSTGENATESNSVTASGKCGENASWEFFDGTLKISGSGEMEDYCDSNMNPLPENSPWNKYSDEIKKVQIENGITSIGIGTIMDFPNLVDVEIANTVTYIQRWSFSNCPSLKSITLPESITNVGRESFGNCDNLSSITIMNNKIFIENWCFGSCKNLDVYFNGTEEEWKSTFQAMANDTLATANFNSIALQGDANRNGTN